MFLKRIFTGEEGNRVFDHLKVISHNKTQNFTQKFIDKGIEEGYVTLSKGNITIHAKPNDLVYKIVRMPGWYCCHDDKKMESSEDAKRYLIRNFKGKKSPDSNNPSGYRKDNFYHCKLTKD